MMDDLQEALRLLTSGRRAEVDHALMLLERDEVRDQLTVEQRPALRRKLVDLMDGPPAQDKAGLLREKLTRLLAHIAHPDDRDVFIRAATTYYVQPVEDVAQNLRSAGLIGLAEIDRELACLYAVRLLGEKDTSRFNGEPSVTAVNVLERFGQTLALLQFVIAVARAYDPRQGESVARAFEALPVDLPEAALLHAAQPYVEAGHAVPCTGIINLAVKREEEALHDLLEQMLTSTHDTDLHRYGTVMLATSRKPALVERLYRLANLSPLEYVRNYREAVELTTHPRRDEVVAMLGKREKRKSG
ncbi:MAG TPA: hypothetical protein PLQ56_23205 [Aggregatilineales bacterium]|nr:hypothetical protein [Aggregatilineales bacterium]